MQPMRTRVDSSSSCKSVRNVYVSEKLRCRSNLLRCWSDVELSLTDIDFALLVDLDLLWLVVVTGVSVMDSCLVTAGRMLRRLSVSDRESPLDFLGSASDFPAKWILWFRIQITPTFSGKACWSRPQRVEVPRRPKVVLPRHPFNKKVKWTRPFFTGS